MRIDTIFDPENQPMNIVGFFSGGASSYLAVLEKQRVYQREVDAGKIEKLPFRSSIAFTDDPKASGIKKIEAYGVQVIKNDLEQYHITRGLPGIRDKKARREMDKDTVREIRETFDFDNAESIGSALNELGEFTDFALLSGYMWYLTDAAIDSFEVIQNVHPADLTIKNEKGKRKFIGDNAVLDAIVAGQTYTKSSIHIVTQGIDEGPLTVQSKALEVEPEIVQWASELKKGYKNTKAVISTLLANKDEWHIVDYSSPMNNSAVGIREELLELLHEEYSVNPAEADTIIRVMHYSEKHQGKMKTECDIPAFIRSVELTAAGQLALKDGKVYMLDNEKWTAILNGHQLKT